MIINPKRAVKKGWIYPVEEHQVQPNGIDIRLKAVYEAQSIPRISEEVREIPKFKELKTDANDFYWLKTGRFYVFDAVEYIKVPKDVVARVLVRSTLNRAGLLVVTGLWDSNFEGQLGGALRPRLDIQIRKNTRIGQVVFEKGKAYKPYEGVYKYQKTQAQEL